MAVEFDRAAPGHAFLGSDLLADTLEKGRAGVGIGIDKDEPIARGCGSARIAGAGDLVDGFEDDLCCCGTSDFGGFVGRIVVADDEFSFPVALMESRQRTINVAQRFAEALFFVKSRDDDRDFQVAPVLYNIGRLSHVSLTRPNSRAETEKTEVKRFLDWEVFGMIRECNGERSSLF